MNYANQAAAQDARSLPDRIGGGRIGGTTQAPTLSMRLEQANAAIETQCRRIEHALNRAEGCPPTPEGVAKDSAIRAQLPLALSVENSENLVKRLAELAERLDRIA